MISLIIFLFALASGLVARSSASEVIAKFSTSQRRIFYACLFILIALPPIQNYLQGLADDKKEDLRQKKRCTNC
jgi:hypothetical protein